MKAQKCQLILHGSCRIIMLDYFDSISKAKKFAKECWNRPYTIIKIKS